MLFIEDMMTPSWQCIHFCADSAFDRKAFEGTDLTILQVDGEGLESDVELFRRLAAAFRFPDYFGWNWDALDECMRDLSWLPSSAYLLSVTDAAPFWRSAPRVAGALVETWLSAAEEWAREEVAFHLVFSW